MAMSATVLVLEDNEISREGTSLILRRAGYEVAAFGDGKAALDYCRSNNPPDVILLDMIIPPPAWDGWQFLDRRKADPALASVPVILTTGLTVACKEWAASLGAVGLVRKPVDHEPLLAEVRRCLAKTDPSKR
jgi:two-component system, sensor histidine kinase and response regulator